MEDELSLLTDSSLVLVSYTNIHRMHLLSLLSFPGEEENSAIREEEVKDDDSETRHSLRTIRAL